ncbi:protein cappuccino isoform X2 [Wyeomyia smithii]|uniref:protein cappuccino isoform X2 n=1 Tax=Wyeomyia smithii TaxID=174621 RepID=UPI0024681D2D|nr:protein cappuccino isoform X2 [Wyeomyia smithii]
MGNAQTASSESNKDGSLQKLPKHNLVKGRSFMKFGKKKQLLVDTGDGTATMAIDCNSRSDDEDGFSHILIEAGGGGGGTSAASSNRPGQGHQQQHHQQQLSQSADSLLAESAALKREFEFVSGSECFVKCAKTVAGAHAKQYMGDNGPITAPLDKADSVHDITKTRDAASFALPVAAATMGNSTTMTTSANAEDNNNKIGTSESLTSIGCSATQPTVPLTPTQKNINTSPTQPPSGEPPSNNLPAPIAAIATKPNPNSLSSKLVLNESTTKQQTVYNYDPASGSIIVTTDSWKRAQSLSENVTSVQGSLEQCKDRPGRFHLLEHTTSSSSDSIFTDPATPIGPFATEINQAYYSEEDLAAARDEEESTPVRKEPSSTALKLQWLSVHRIDPIDLCANQLADDNWREKLSIANVSNICVKSSGYKWTANCHVEAVSNISLDGGINETEFNAEDTTDDNCAEMALNLRNNMATSCASVHIQNTDAVTTPTEETKDKGIFNVARVKKVELTEIKTPNSLYATPLPITQSVERVSTVCTDQQQWVTPRLPVGEGNVLRKVVSLSSGKIGDSTPVSKISRPTFVPEKLNFSAYEKFEGQMLMNWLASTLQYTNVTVTEQELHTVMLQYCTNLMVAGVIKQIPDKLAPIQETFRPNLMYQWTHTEVPSPAPLTPGRLEPHIVWPHAVPSIETTKSAAHSTTGPPENVEDRTEESAMAPKTSTPKQDPKLKVDLNVEDLKNKVSRCETLSDVKKLIRTFLTEVDGGDSSPVEIVEGKNRKCLLSDLLNESDVTIYQIDKEDKLRSPEASSKIPPMAPPVVSNEGDQETLRTNGKFSNECGSNSNNASLPNSISNRKECSLPHVNTSDSISNMTNGTVFNNNFNEANISNYICKNCCKQTVTSTGSDLNALGSQNLSESGSDLRSTQLKNFVTQETQTDLEPVPLNTIGSYSVPPRPSPSSPPPVPLILFAPSLQPPPPPPLPLPPPPPPPPPALPPIIPQAPPPPPPMLPGAPRPPVPGVPPLPPPPPPPFAPSLAPVRPTNGPCAPPPPPLLNAVAALTGPALRKSAVNPPKPMKPLYWTRIVAPKMSPVTETDSAISEVADEIKPALWQELEETNLDNLDEFTELFSRQVVVPKVREKVEKPEKTLKVLDSKRSQNVGIFAKSLHVDFDEIEFAIYHCDTSVVNLEALQKIMEIKATDEELAQIKECAEGNIPLDPPEQFLLRISNISSFSERISCIVFQAEFDEHYISVTRKLETVKHTCEFLIDSEELKHLFSIILTLGNYMNGGNRTRGQADGFGLEILGKLKDVKSKDNNITLLHFIIKTYISQCRKSGQLLHDVKLPVPDPGDLDRVVLVDFDDCKTQLNMLKSKTDECRRITDKVIAESAESNIHPFKEKMEAFIEVATKRIEKQYRKLDECREIFTKTMIFYKFTPKSGTLEECKPELFFEPWTSFSHDFKNIFKKEILHLSNELLKKTKRPPPSASTSQKQSSTGKLKAGSLKERLKRLSSKN